MRPPLSNAQRQVDENRIGGAVALVLRDGRPVYEKAFGWSDKEAGRRMSTDTPFRIASLTKVLTSVAILALMEEGGADAEHTGQSVHPRLRQDHCCREGRQGCGAGAGAARKHDPRSVDAHRGHLLLNRPRDRRPVRGERPGPGTGFGWYNADKDEGTCDTMERLATLPFVAQPGEAYVYGYNTDVLGCVVERASGMPLDRFIATRITTPLGMKDTYFFVPAEQRARLAVVYSSGPDGTIVRAPEGARGALRRRAAQEFRGRRRAGIDGALDGVRVLGRG